MDQTGNDDLYAPRDEPVDGVWSFEVSPHCSRCDRLAVVYGPDDEAYCARHGTIFITMANEAKDRVAGDT